MVPFEVRLGVKLRNSTDVEPLPGKYLQQLECFLGAFVKSGKVTNLRYLGSVRLSAWNRSDPTGRTFIKFDI